MARPLESDYASQVAYTRALEAYCDTLAQPVQEPVEVCCGDYYKCCKPCTLKGRYYGEKLTPQRPWVGLTDEERINISYKADGNECVAVELTEAKLKENNFD